MNKVRIKARTPRTTALLPKRNFLVGMGSVLNLRGQYFEYKSSDSALLADMKALRCDWEMTGRDLREAKRRLHKSM